MVTRAKPEFYDISVCDHLTPCELPGGTHCISDPQNYLYYTLKFCTLLHVLSTVLKYTLGKS